MKTLVLVNRQEAGAGSCDLTGSILGVQAGQVVHRAPLFCHCPLSAPEPNTLLDWSPVCCFLLVPTKMEKLCNAERWMTALVLTVQCKRTPSGVLHL